MPHRVTACVNERNGIWQHDSGIKKSHRNNKKQMFETTTHKKLVKLGLEHENLEWWGDEEKVYDPARHHIYVILQISIHIW